MTEEGHNYTFLFDKEMPWKKERKMIKERLPTHCDKCGKKLVTNELYRRYDRYTGDPVDIVVTVKCPSHQKILWVFGNGHLSEKIDLVDDKV